MASFVTNRAKADFAKGLLDWDAPASIKAMLVTATNDADKDNDYIGDIVTLAELSGSGYVGGFGGAGRTTLANTSVEQDESNEWAALKADNVLWSQINAGTAAAVLVVKEVTNDADSILIAKLEFTPVVTNGGDFTIKWDNQNSNGTVLRLT